MGSEDSRPELNEAWKTWYDFKSGRESEKGYYAIEEMSKSEKPEVRCKCERLCRFLGAECVKIYKITHSPGYKNLYKQGISESLVKKDNPDFFEKMFCMMESVFLPTFNIDYVLREKSQEAYPYFCMGCEIRDKFLWNCWGIKLEKFRNRNSIRIKVTVKGGEMSDNDNMYDSLDDSGDEDENGDNKHIVANSPDLSDSLQKRMDYEDIAKVFWKEICIDSKVLAIVRPANTIPPEKKHAEAEKRRAAFYARIHDVTKSDPELLKAVNMENRQSAFERWGKDLMHYLLSYCKEYIPDFQCARQSESKLGEMVHCIKEYACFYSEEWTDQSELGQKLKAFVKLKQKGKKPPEQHADQELSSSQSETFRNNDGRIPVLYEEFSKNRKEI